AVHHSDVFNLARIHVSIDGAWGPESAIGVQVVDQPDGAVIPKRTTAIHRGGRIAGLQLRPYIRDIEFIREVRARLAAGDLGEPGQRSEGEHVRLRAVAHRRVTVTARDLLALDRAVHSRSAAVNRFRVIGGCDWVSERAGGEL